MWCGVIMQTGHPHWKKEVKLHFFFSFVVDWGEQGETPSRRMGSNDRSQQQSWLLAPVLNDAKDLIFFLEGWRMWGWASIYLLLPVGPAD